ncbi:MAG: quinone oxidoreductase [Betaproteobacteria bacterium]|nr:quinone oxidoreductase [Betaproteobacteria bacterium]
MPKGTRIHTLGGPEVLRWEDIEVSAPSPGELQVRHTAIGLNFIDIYHRTGIYPIPLPAIIGSEAVEIIESVGPDVGEFKPGDRIAYAPLIGAYCEIRNLPAERAIHVPAEISDDEAAGMMLKGMTARSLVRRAYPVRKGDAILVHAAAGGVGLILCQWAKSLGATVLGTVGSEEKAALAAANGCDHPIQYRKVDFVGAVRGLTKRADLLASANDLFDVVKRGAVKIAVRRRYALSDAINAHRDLEGRNTDGSFVLIP